MQRLLVISLFFLYSCSPPAKSVSEAPSDLIPQEKMVGVLTDVHLLEAALSIRSSAPPRVRRGIPQEFIHDSISPSVSSEPQKRDTLPYYNIFKSHEVTKKQYQSSMAWYSENPEKLNELYDLVIIELTKRQAEDRIGKKIVNTDSLKGKK